MVKTQVHEYHREDEHAACEPVQVCRRNHGCNFGTGKRTGSTEYTYGSPRSDADISFAEMTDRSGQGRKGHGTEARTQSQMNGHAKSGRQHGNDHTGSASPGQPQQAPHNE